METKAKKIFDEYKKTNRRRHKKTCFIIFSILGILCILCSIIFAILYGLFVGVCIFVGCAMTLVFAHLTIIFVFKSYLKPHLKEVCVDGIEIGAFVGYGESRTNHGVNIHLIVNGKEYSKFVELKYYYHCDDLFTIFETVRYSIDKYNDKKNGKNIAVLTKKIEGKTVSVIYEKYSKKLIIKVDDKAY